MIHGENARSAKKELRRTQGRVNGWSCLSIFSIKQEKNMK